jgi:hypothetical protein
VTFIELSLYAHQLLHVPHPHDEASTLLGQPNGMAEVRVSVCPTLTLRRTRLVFLDVTMGLTRVKVLRASEPLGIKVGDRLAGGPIVDRLPLAEKQEVLKLRTRHGRFFRTACF